MLSKIVARMRFRSVGGRAAPLVHQRLQHVHVFIDSCLSPMSATSSLAVRAAWPIRLALALIACTPNLPSLSDPCRFRSQVEHVGDGGYGVRTGPIWFVGFPPELSTAQIRVESSATPTKFVLLSVGPITSDLRVSGRHCASGSALRFEYPFVTAGDGSFIVPKSERRVAEPGYVYLSPGRSIIEVFAAENKLGQSIIDVVGP